MCAIVCVVVLGVQKYDDEDAENDVMVDGTDRLTRGGQHLNTGGFSACGSFF